MIKDKIENIGRYTVNENFEIFKEEIKNFQGQLEKLQLPFKVIPLEYETGEFDLHKFENHERNIDVHYIIEGSESIGLSSLKDLDPVISYDEEGDYQLFQGKVHDLIVLKEGEFLVLFPGEAHVTGGNNNRSSVRKIVFKIPKEKS